MGNLTSPRARWRAGDAMAEHDRILIGLADLGQRVILLPKVSVPERLAFVLQALE